MDASGANPREDELRLARRALASGLIDGPALSRALLEWSASGWAPLAPILARKGPTPEQLDAIRAGLGPAPAPAVDDRPSKEDPRVGQIVQAVRCDVRVEKAALWSAYVGRLPRDPEPAGLLLIELEAMRQGLWMDFLETVRATKDLTSPHLERVLDVGRDQGCFAVVTRARPGAVTLRALVDRVRRLKMSEALRITRELGQGLVELHAKGLVHRDVRAENALLGRDGQAFLRRAGVVFEPEGLGPSTPKGSVFGAPHSIAPESLRGSTQDPPNDIYGLGVVLYELVTGVRPFEGEGIGDLRSQVLEQTALRPDEVLKDVPDGICELLTWMLAKKPKDRPPAPKLVNVIQTLERGITRTGATTRMQALQ